MNDLENLYKQVIFDHYKNPRNKGLKGYDHVHLRNPSCGDDITVEIKIKDGVIEEINHAGSGCSICCSSASVLSETLKGKTVDEAKHLIQEFYDMMIGKDDPDEELEEGLKRIERFIKTLNKNYMKILFHLIDIFGLIQVHSYLNQFHFAYNQLLNKLHLLHLIQSYDLQ